MEKIDIVLFTYFIATGTFEAIISGSDCSYYASANEMFARAILGLLFGWIKIPIRFCIGLYEIFVNYIRR